MFGFLKVHYESAEERKSIHDKGDVWARSPKLRPHPNVRVWPGIPTCFTQYTEPCRNPLMTVTDAFDWHLVSGVTGRYQQPRVIINVDRRSAA